MSLYDLFNNAILWKESTALDVCTVPKKGHCLSGHIKLKAEVALIAKLSYGTENIKLFSPWYNRHGWLGVKNQLSIY